MSVLHKILRAEETFAAWMDFVGTVQYCERLRLSLQFNPSRFERGWSRLF